jgi:hypothetical protein
MGWPETRSELARCWPLASGQRICLTLRLCVRPQHLVCFECSVTPREQLRNFESRERGVNAPRFVRRGLIRARPVAVRAGSAATVSAESHAKGRISWRGGTVHAAQRFGTNDQRGRCPTHLRERLPAEDGVTHVRSPGSATPHIAAAITQVNRVRLVLRAIRNREGDLHRAPVGRRMPMGDRLMSGAVGGMCSHPSREMHVRTNSRTFAGAIRRSVDMRQRGTEQALQNQQ